jgi:DNA-binding transcriptional ArsR family regulator
LTSHGLDETAILVSPASRELRRTLRPVAWVILEEVALAAMTENGRLVARTSARRVAEQLGLNPGTVDRALRRLRDRGLLVAERETGQAGRFGLSVYVLDAVNGMAVVPARPAEPYLVTPSVEKPDPAKPEMAPSAEVAPHVESIG